MTEEAATEVAEAPVLEDSPPPEDQDTSLEEAAAPEDDDSQADTSTDTGDETPSDEGPAKGSSTALQKLLSKYDGDEDAMVAAYFEQANSSSRLHSEMQELREALMREDEADPEEAIAEDPDVKGLKDQRDSLQQDIDAVQQDQMQLVGAYGQVETEIKQLDIAVAKAEDFEKVTLQQQLSSKKSELRQIMSSVNRGRREMNAINRGINDIDRQHTKARQAVLSRKESQRKQELQGQRVARLAREDFNTTIRSEAERFGINLSSKQFNVLSTSVRNQLHHHLDRLPKDSPAVDIPAATKRLMGQFAEAMSLKPKFQKVSEGKRTPMNSGPKDAMPVLPKGVKEPALPKAMEQFGKDGKNWSLEFSKARAKKMLGD